MGIGQIDVRGVYANHLVLGAAVSCWGDGLTRQNKWFFSSNFDVSLGMVEHRPVYKNKIRGTELRGLLPASGLVDLGKASLELVYLS